MLTMMPLPVLVVVACSVRHRRVTPLRLACTRCNVARCMTDCVVLFLSVTVILFVFASRCVSVSGWSSAVSLCAYVCSWARVFRTDTFPHVLQSTTQRLLFPLPHSQHPRFGNPIAVLPVMALITYVLIVGYVLGQMHQFTPEQLGVRICAALLSTRLISWTSPPPLFFTLSPPPPLFLSVKFISSIKKHKMP